MAAQHNHDLLILGLVGGAGFLAYELFKHMSGGAAVDPFAPFTTSPAPGNMISMPTGAAPGGVQGSIVDARVSPGGDVGTAMWKKGWTQGVATDRLAKEKAAYANAMQQSAINTGQGDTVGAANWKAAAATFDANYFALTDRHLA